jgi:HPt (histidine-containing phosphotransfer) domain-containing protein
VLGFADNVSDQTRLRLGLTQAHQLHATLRLLGVPSAEQLAREIEDTVQAMLHGRIEPSGTNLQLLLAASMQLPAYLHRVAAERRESPLDVLGLVNDLRGARAEASPAGTAAGRHHRHRGARARQRRVGGAGR